MIRLIQRRLIVPRGDTGTFSIPVLAGKDSGDVSIFTIFDTLTHRKVFEKVMQMSNGVLSMDLTHGDTVNLPVGQYVWDIKFYSNPVFADEKLVGGTEVDSYYSAFNLPICEIRETGDNLLMADDAPTSKLAPDQINYVEAALTEMQNTKDAVLGSVESASASAAAAEDSKDAAIAAQALAEAAATSAADSAQTATEAAAQFAIDLNTKANVADLATVATSGDYDDLVNKPIIPVVPSNVSAFTNDAGYLTQHQDISGKANSADLAAVATSGSYNDLSNKPTIPVIPTDISAFTNDVGYLTQHQDISGKANSADLATVATSGSYNDLSNKPTIPSRVSDLTDDSGHYTKPVGGIPASDLAAGVLDVWSGLTYHTSTMSTDADSFVLGGATDSPTEINKCLITSTPVANVIPKFDYQGRLHSTTPEEEWDGSNTVATTAYVDTMITNNMPDVPTDVSELNNDAGYLTSYTETDPTVPSWAKAAQKPTYTAQEVGALPSNTVIPTSVSQLTNDAGYLTSFTETDPTVPAWAKAQTKPTYTAAEVGAPTVQEMNTAIGNAIGNINSFDIAVVQELPSSDISTHTIYLVPKTGETNDVYDEYVYINNAWEMIGNTQIDLSNYVQKIDIADTTKAGIVKINPSYGIGIINDYLMINGASSSDIKAANNSTKAVSAYRQHESTFYGLAKAAGDSTQFQSDNAVGTYTDEAKSAIQTMLDVPSKSDIPDIQVNGTSVVDNGIANIPVANASTFGVVRISSGLYNTNGAIGVNDSTEANIKSGKTGTYTQVNKQHIATFYGLAKAADADMKDIANTTVGTYPDAQKAAIQNMLGITDLLSTEETTTATAAHALNSLFLMDGKLHRVTAAIAIGDAVAAGTNCEVVKADEVFVKNTDYATGQSLGLVKVNTGYGITLDSTDRGMAIIKATTTQIKTGTNIYFPIVSANAHEAVFYGLAKAAGDTTQAASSNAVGAYTTEAKTSIRAMIGAGTPLDVQINGTSIVSSGVANIPVASDNTIGTVKTNSTYGTAMRSSPNQDTIIVAAAQSSDIKSGNQGYKPIVPSKQHEAVFYGLATAANDSTQTTSSNAVGTYTETAKTAIRAMLGATSSNVIAVQDEQPTNTDTKIWLPETESTGIQVPTMEDMNTALAGKVGDVQVNGTSIVSNGIADIPIGSTSNLGVVKFNWTSGVKIVSETGVIAIDQALANEIKVGTHSSKPIVPLHQHEAAFYGLAKAAGDTTMASSSNAVGTYTTEAKAAIHTMLGIDPASIAAQVDIPLVETVSGTTPTITGQPNVRYVCGEVSTISITPPASGSVDVIFESGSTATTMTVPSTVKWPAWFDAENLEANTTYEVLITDGVYGSVMTWAT